MTRSELLLIKDRVLGPGYDLSLAFVSAARARALNRRFRGENYSPEVLSFPLGPGEGEILINRDRVGKKRILKIFIHGLLHLRGAVHGSKMEREEERLIHLLHGQHRRRARHRQPKHQIGRRRGDQGQ